MRSAWLAPAAAALACLPCVFTLLVAAGIGTGALSALGAALFQPGVAVAGALAAVLLFATGALVLVRRRSVAECDIDEVQVPRADTLPRARAEQGEVRR